jgi:WD40 repeat protein
MDLLKLERAHSQLATLMESRCLLHTEVFPALLDSITELSTASTSHIVRQLHSIAELTLHNSQVIWQAEDSCAFVSRLIELYLSNYEELGNILDFLRSLVSRCGVRKELVAAVYRSVRDNGAPLLVAFKVLKTLLNHPGANDPLNYFYFSGVTQGLKVMRPAVYPFAKAYSGCFWLRLEEVGSSTIAKLFVLHCDDQGGIEAYFVGPRLYFRALAAEYRDPSVGSNGIFIHSFRPCEWTYFAFEHERSRIGRHTLRAVVDGAEVISATMDFPPLKSKTPAMTHATLCEGLTGQLACCMFFKDAVGINKLKSLYVNYTSYGPQAHDSIRSLSLVFDKSLTNNIVLFLHPLRTSEEVAYEGVSGLDAAITHGAGVKLTKSCKTAFLGGIIGLLPLLEGILSQSENQGGLLHEWIGLLFICLRDNPENQLEACRVKFFKAVADIWTRFDSADFTEATVGQLEAIVYNVLPSLREQLTVYLLWSLDVWHNTKAEHSVLVLIKALYAATPKTCAQLFGTERVLNVLLGVYDSLELTCCAKHGGQGSLDLVSEAFTSIIQSAIRVQPQDLKFLVNALFVRTSPCVQGTMLRVLLNLFKASGEQAPVVFYRCFVECKGVEMLLYVVFSSRNEQKALCLQGIDALVRISPKALGIFSRKDLMTYLAAVVSPPPGRFDEARSSYDAYDFERMSLSSLPEDSFEFNEHPMTQSPSRTDWGITPETAPSTSRKYNFSIDTDTINQGFTFGGERGRTVVERADLISQISDLAHQCLTYQRGEARLRSKSLQPQKEPLPTPKKARRSQELLKTPSEVTSDEEASLYISVLQLVLQRPLSAEAMLDDTDVITNVEALSLLLSMIENSSQALQQRLVQDLLMLTKWNASNKAILSKVGIWHTWLLNLVLGARADTPTNMLIRDMGFRLHTSVVLQAYLTDDQAWKHFKALIVWTEALNPTDQEAAVAIARHLAISLIEGLCSYAAACRPSLSSAMWKNIVSSAFLVQELVMLRPSLDSNQDWQLLSLDFADSLWQDLSIVKAFFDLCEPIWPKALLESVDSPTLMSYHQLTLALTRSSKDTFKTDYQLLLYEPSGELKARGCFLNVVLQLSSLVLSTTKDPVLLETWVQKQQRIATFVLLVAEASSKLLSHSAIKTFKQALCFLLGHICSLMEDSKDLHIRMRFKESLVQLLSCLFSVHLQVIEDQPRTDHRSSLTSLWAGYSLHVSTQVIRAMSELSHEARVVDNDEIKRMQLQNYEPIRDLVDREDWQELLKALYSSVQESVFSFTMHASFASLRAKAVGKLKAERLSLLSQAEGVTKSVQDKVLNLAAEAAEAEEHRRQVAIAYATERSRQRRMMWSKLKKTLLDPTGAWALTRPSKLVPYLVFNFEMARPYLKTRSVEAAVYMGKNQELQPASLSFMCQVAAQQDIKGSGDEEDSEDYTEASSTVTSRREYTEANPTVFSRREPALKEVMANDHRVFHKEVGWLTPLSIRYGLLEVVNSMLRFVSDPCSEQKFVAHVSISKYAPAEDKPCVKEWPIQALVQVLPRTYVLRKTALEFFFADGRSYLFNCASADDRSELMDVVTAAAKKAKTALSRVFTGKQSCTKVLARSGLTEKWVNWEISNFEYLLQLNFIAGRSFHDLTQYPVMPWVLSDYSSRTLNLKDPAVYRDLTKPMGGQGPSSRTEFFVDRFHSTLGGPEPAFHYGSHYSNPGIVLHYLLRLFPYSEGFKELHDGKFDLPDRLFSSVFEAYRLTTEDISDVKELIPEFYFLPEFLLNLEDHDFGLTQMGDKVHDVRLPPWASNAYEFISIMREALESDLVSAKLNDWIDLIFGYKQQGEAAVAALNAFFYMTYEGSVDLDKVTDSSLRKAMEAQVVHFGRTPTQLLKKPHPRRQAKPESLNVLSRDANLKLFDPVVKRTLQAEFPRNYCELPEQVLLHAAMVGRNKIVGLRCNGTVTNYTWSPIQASGSEVPFTLAKDKEISISDPYKSAKIEARDRSFATFEAPVAILRGGKTIVQGGFWDGRLIVNHLDLKQAKSLVGHSSTVTCIDVDAEEQTVLTGSKDGDIVLWTIDKDTMKPSRQYADHSGPVTAVRLCRALQVFASVGVDGRCLSYSLLSGRLLRQISLVGKPLATLAFAPVAPSKVLLFTPVDKSLYSFSVNGALLHRTSESSQHIIRPVVLHNLNWKEFLLYGTEKGEIVMRAVSNLLPLRRLSVPQQAPVVSVFVSAELRFLFAACGNGEVTVMVSKT